MPETLQPHPNTQNKAGKDVFSQLFGDNVFRELTGIADIEHVFKELGNHLRPIPEKTARHLGGAAARSAQKPHLN